MEIPELKLGKEHDVAVVIAKAGRVELDEAAEGAEAATDVPAAKVDGDDAGADQADAE